MLPTYVVSVSKWSTWPEFTSATYATLRPGNKPLT
jgi:hypothetical protein